MILADVHCHLNHKYFQDKLDLVINDAKKSGVRAIIVNGVNQPTNEEVIELAKKYDIVKPALGLYPLDALGVELPYEDELGLTKQKKVDVDKNLEFIEKHKKEIVAIGEVGIDLKYLPNTLKQQRENFQKVIDLAEKIKKPLIVHSRNAELNVIEMLESSKCSVVLHSFGGRKHLVKRALDNGWSFSIPAVIKRLKHFEMIVELAQINQLLTETDSPWMSPYVGERNQPSFVVEGVKKIAEIKKFNEEETSNSLFLNYQRMFL